MKKKWIAVVASVLVVMVIAGLLSIRGNKELADSMPQPAPWPTPTSSVNYQTPPAQVFTFMCELSDQFKPTTFYSACADGYAGIGKIVWTSWGASGASGYGYRFANPCNPDCASDSSRYTNKVFLKLDTPIQMGKKVYLTTLHSAVAMGDGGMAGDPIWDDWDLGYDFRMMQY